MRKGERRLLSHVEDQDGISILFMEELPAFVGLMMKGFSLLMWKTRRWDLGIFNGESKSDFW